MDGPAAHAAAKRNIGLQRIERISRSLRRPAISHVIFDFDGTLSWLRHGWPRIMLDGFLLHAPADWRASGRTRAELLADILSLNGKPTIHQMKSFADRLLHDAGRSVDPQQLFDEYEQRLHNAITERRESIVAGTARDSFVIFGARRILGHLRDRNIRLIILSGTVETEVRSEAVLLGLAEFFGEHIYGSVRGVAFSKKDVIDRVMREEGIEGHHLLSFGDGPVELSFTRAVGGLAIGVASDEDHNGSHKADPFKREQLVRAGADAVIPDYAEGEALLAEILGS